MRRFLPPQAGEENPHLFHELEVDRLGDAAARLRREAPTAHGADDITVEAPVGRGDNLDVRRLAAIGDVELDDDDAFDAFGAARIGILRCDLDDAACPALADVDLARARRRGLDEDILAGWFF
jgi:hypothetical protein